MDGWCFAIINGKLAEIYFVRKKGKTFINAHCYINLKDFKTKSERKDIKEDTEKYKFSYRNNNYKDLNTEQIFPQTEFQK